MPPWVLKPKPKVWRLLNQTPIDGCLLVFNATARDWRTKASDFKRRCGISFRIHAITGASRAKAHGPDPSDLYIIIKDMYGRE